MSTETQIIALFEEGNPVPDVDALDPVDLDATAYLAALRAGSRSMTKVEEKIDRSERKRPSNVWLAAAAAVLVIVVGGVALMQASGTNDPAPPAEEQEPEPPALEMLTPESLAGNEFRVVGGTNQDLPERLAFAQDGTFVVFDRGGVATDNGAFAITGDQVSFTSEWVEGRGPLDYGVIWAYPVCPGCNFNTLMRTDKCEGVVGEYRLVFDAPGRLTLDLVSDACLLRNYVGKGLELEIVDAG